MKKKLLILILTVAMLLPMFSFTVSASVDPYKIVQATSFDRELSYIPSGSFEVLSNRVGGVMHNTWLAFPDLSFGDKAPTHIEIEAGARSGYADTVVVRLDDPQNGTIVAEVKFEQIEFAVPSKNRVAIDVPITGKHTIYISSKRSTMNFYNFRFIVPQEKSSGYEKYKPGGAYEGLDAGTVATAADLLWQLGILQDKRGIEFDKDAPVSRARFANAIYGIYKDREPGEVVIKEGETHETGFSDVKSDSIYAEAIAFLSEYGVIKGDEEGLFLPHHYIKTLDAMVILVRLLGYGDLAESFGGYPQGYIKAATQAGISVSGNVQEPLRRGTAVLLLNSAFKADYLEASGLYIPDVVKYEKTEGILGMYRNLTRGTGKVTATCISGLTIPETGLSANMIQIDDVLYNIGTTNALSLLGYECEFYYEEDGGDRTLRAIAADRRVNILDISSAKDEIVEISNKEIVYIPSGDDSEESIDLTKDANIFYNGVAIEGKLTEAVKYEDNFKGFITVAENPDESLAVYVEEYEDYVIETIGLDGLSFIGADGTGAVSWAEKDKFYMQDADGMMISMAEVDIGSLVTVYESCNTSGIRLIRIFTTEAEVEGVVNKIADEKVYINDVEYTVSNNSTEPFTMGKEGIFRLNIYGDLVASEDQKPGSWQVGLLMSYNVGRTGINKDTQLKILTTEPKEMVFNAASTFTADGIQLKESTDIVNGKSTTDGKWVGLAQIEAETAVRYRINDAGEIYQIDTPKEGKGGAGDTLKCLLNSGSEHLFTYYPSAGLMFSKTESRSMFHMPNTTTVMAFYGDKEHGEANCAVNTAKNIIQKTDYSLYGGFYSTVGDDYKADLFVWKNLSDALAMDAMQMFVYDSTTIGLDSDGDQVTLLNGWTSGRKTAFVYDKSGKVDINPNCINVLDNLKQGDVLGVTVFSGTSTLQNAEMWCMVNGEAERAALITAPKVSKNSTSSGSTATKRGAFGKVMEKGDGYAVIQIGTDVSGNPLGETLSLGSASVCVVETGAANSDRVVKAATYSNVAVGNTVFTYTYSGACQCIVVFVNASH